MILVVTINYAYTLYMYLWLGLHYMYFITQRETSLLIFHNSNVIIYICTLQYTCTCIQRSLYIHVDGMSHCTSHAELYKPVVAITLIMYECMYIGI